MVDEAPGITRLLDRLESRQFVRRERAKPDRRQVNCYITAKGLDVLRKLDPVIEGDAEWTSSDSLSKGEHRTLVKLLALVRANLEAKLAQDD
jgi:DNA-binding MarR family transcriptional regulator